MKRNLTGDEAYLKMKSAELPEKTASYTPIAHNDILRHLRKEIRDSGFMICGEEYKCNADGQVKVTGERNPGGTVALGLVRVFFQPDPDLVLCASFLNSYNKKYAFRFVLAGQVALTGNAIIMGGDVYGSYKRVHTGNADAMATGTMSTLIKGAVDYWQSMVEFKENLKLVEVSSLLQHDVLGELFLRDGTLNGFQLNVVKEELAKICDPLLGNMTNGWDFYNAVATAIKDAHPAEWMDTHMQVQSKFDQLVLGKIPAVQQPAHQPVSGTGAVFYWRTVEKTGTVHNFMDDYQNAFDKYADLASRGVEVLLEYSELEFGVTTTWELSATNTPT